jgi:hypothetical protein
VNLSAIPTASLPERVANAASLAALERLAAECDRRRGKAAAAAARMARLRARAFKAAATRRARNAPPPPPPPAPPKRARTAKPAPLVAFLVRQGGIREHRGDMLAVMGTYRARPGLVNNQPRRRTPDGTAWIGGLPLDIAAMMARDAGYFPEHARHDGVDTMSTRALLEAIDEELRGRPRYINGEAPTAEIDEGREEADMASAEVADAAHWRTVIETLRKSGWAAVYNYIAERADIGHGEDIPW